ncbi:hypothetical protein Ciccas_012933 [Cichlidogyrus casuarinus]|uniref:EF-hand domain-containing protein n=1 Tax=Cichlidogyrus casuarinus TaxID=1844966 RepID=A0ABD2PM11_9PLAT
MEIEGLKQQFRAIDRECKNYLLPADIERYCIANDLETSMVDVRSLLYLHFPQSWMNLFDSDDDGRIGLGEFLESLGIEYNDADLERFAYEGALDDPHFKEISSTMNHETRCKIVLEVKRRWNDKLNLHDADEVKTLVREIKVWMDNAFGRAWQVIAVKGSYWSMHSHMEGTTFFFKYHDIISKRGKDHIATVTELVPGGPADISGVCLHDEVLSINSSNVQELSCAAIEKLLLLKCPLRLFLVHHSNPKKQRIYFSLVDAGAKRHVSRKTAPAGTIVLPVEPTGLLSSWPKSSSTSLQPSRNKWRPSPHATRRRAVQSSR